MTAVTRTRWIVALAAALFVAVCVTMVVLALMMPTGKILGPDL